MILIEFKRFALVGLFLASIISVSARSSDEIAGIILSYEFLNPKDVSDEFMNHLDDPAALSVSSGDPAIVTVYDFVGLQGMSFLGYRGQ